MPSPPRILISQALVLQGPALLWEGLSDGMAPRGKWEEVAGMKGEPI